MKTFVLRLTPGTLAANDDTNAPTVDEQIIALHRQQVTRRRIMAALGVTEHHVRRLTKGVDVDVSQPQPATTPFERAVRACYPLAISSRGIKDYQFRDIMFRAYGRQWNTATGVYDGTYTDDHLYRVRKRVRELAKANGETAVFAMDWFNTGDPLASNRKIRECAMGLAERVQDVVDEFMQAMGVSLAVLEGTPTEFEGEMHERELAKQAAAARLHILKLAISEVGAEPISVLMERAEQQANGLARLPDESLPKVDVHKDYHPEPTGNNAFLDYIEERRWLPDEWYTERAERLADMGG
ncbi:hypothetical protein [Pseudomonas petrae]|uniref:Uncharacterized protein n=1 Tax=Pseudomonas petrae TaxID=2912190 RepID=A0ABS9ICU4_9PSED|nr:hypothetical protein [Pseudomonas petrae]MCF7544908.1 hypothetical protein [Pseudomonas petrae]